MSNQDILTPTEAAKLLMISPVTLRQWAQKNKIKSHTTLGGHRRFFYADIVNFAKKENITLNQGNGDQALSVKNILVVDDDKPFAQLFETVLKSHNESWNVVVCHDGFEAGIKTQQLRPDIIFVDLMLPGILGDELCRNIKSNPELSSIRIIGMTGNMQTENINSFLKAGAEAVIGKPLDFEQLFSLLK
ncbi:response regulator [Thalassotalea sp. LPB0316]|uniref:response regulator n=1 Tax=Thalassotalea sp. LPB0316 TaxID=2769490 RepID=UPI001867C54B|nr:response regulator [Thalassotalea sp. LPB0316]QOL25601.1 response regulator [Thalassotalea sp. LPB0316]